MLFLRKSRIVLHRTLTKTLKERGVVETQQCWTLTYFFNVYALVYAFLILVVNVVTILKQHW